MTTSPEGLVLRDLHVRYREGPAFVYTLHLSPGQLAAGIGANGSGKSTLLRALIGALPVEGGLMDLQGDPLQALPPRERARRVGYLPQTTPPDPTLTVAETVMLGRFPHFPSLWGPGPEDRKIVEQVLRRMDLWSVRHWPLQRFSGGERQWVELARVVAQDPVLYLLDEADRHLDYPHRHAFLDLLREECRTSRRMVLWVTHDLHGVARSADVLWTFSRDRGVNGPCPPEILDDPSFLDDLFPQPFPLHGSVHHAERAVSG